ncbi:type IX secretion system outer membrane channel protein PorV [Flavobacterium gyeonganense]|uniref:Type IX secretion system outer membrane channel protein PorV n=1 Tax=Flavobacterium gyeonganense TaxID=1310418 RepID=A0ABV5HAJ7_9FLAO|nr:type IX secretion system outer membrane channel protein PorV [Flavobacterium gyeonganense]
MKKISSLLLFYFITISLAKAQERPITTGVPFLQVAADARAAGLGDQGVATSADVFSQQWNPAKYAFSIDKQGFSVSYTPYLTDLVNDISLSQVTYYNKINERSAFAGSVRYFSIGDIELRQNQTDQPNTVKPSEYAIDGSYSLKLSEMFSMAVGARFISSNLGITTEGQSLSAARSFAFDVAGFYQSEEVAYRDFNGRWRAGFNFQNLGPKINYDLSDSDNGSNFLPANLRLGGGFDFILDDYNKVAVGLEFTKLLVPTPQIPVPTATDLNGDGDTTDPGETSNGIQEANNEYNSIGWVPGIFKSFGDAPGGFSEELKEITYSLSGEYTYQDSFSMRAGYFHQSPEKGSVKFFSLGAGFKYNIVKVDVSYLFSASKVKNPLENTLRFSLTFNFGEKYEEY